MRRFFYAFSAITIVVVFVFLGYWLSHRNSSTTSTTTGTLSSGTLPTNQISTTKQDLRVGENEENEVPDTGTIANSVFGPLLDKKIAAFFVNQDGAVTFVETDGRINKLERGEISGLSSAPVENMLAASFSHDGQKVLMILADGKQSSLFDLQTKTWELLPAFTQNPTWAPEGESLVYSVENKNGQKEFYKLDLLAKKRSPFLATTLLVEDTDFTWLSQKNLLINERTTSKIPVHAWITDVTKKTISSFSSGEYGLSMLWDGDQQSLVFSSSQNGRGGTLTLRNGLGAIQKVFSFTTLPSKCVFGDLFASTSSASGKNTEVVCAIPKDQELFNRQTLPDSYEKRALFTSDGLFSINLSSGNIQTLRDVSEDDFDAQQLTISGSSLYFINRLDEKLYRLMATTSTAQ